MFYVATLGMLKWDSLVEYVAIFSCKQINWPSKVGYQYC